MLNIDKRELRKLIKARLKTLTYDRELMGKFLYWNLCGLPEFVAAETIATYVDFQNEAPTRPFLPKLFNNDKLRVKRVAVPYCCGDEMRFVRLDAPIVDAETGEYRFSDLAPGAYGILEPIESVRNDPTRAVDPKTIDFMIAPGLAFSPEGDRLGRGAGYYDRYLPQLRSDATVVGLAYYEQVVEDIPTDEFDFRVSKVITPDGIVKIDRLE